MHGASVPSVACFLLLLAGVAQGCELGRTLRIAILDGPWEEDVALTRWNPTFGVLTVLNCTFDVSVMGFAAVENAVSMGEVDFVFTNPGQSTTFHYNYDARPIVSLENKRKGKVSTVFGSTIVTSRALSPHIKSLADIRNATFVGAGDTAFGAYYTGLHEIYKAGFTLEDLHSIIFTGSPHDKVALRVLREPNSFGCVRTDILEGMLANGIVAADELEVLQERTYPGFPFRLSTPLFPEWAVMCLAHVSDTIAAEVTRALLAISNDSYAATAGGYSRFVYPLNYVSVRKLLLDTGVLGTKPCEPGYGIVAWNQCSQCEIGQYSTSDLKCEPCPQGSFQDRPISSACIPCPPGTHGPTVGLAVCTLCPPGHQQDPSDPTRCLMCDTLSYAPKSGSPDCIPCPRGGDSSSSGGVSCKQDVRWWIVVLSIVVVLTCVGLTAAITALFHAEWRRRRGEREARIMLERRAKELTEANASLEAEILARRDMEDALRVAKKEAEEANVAKSMFLANMSHEIRAPCNGIFLGCQILERDSEASEEQLNILNRMHLSCDMLLNVINDILDYSKLQAGAVEISVRVFPCNLLVETCASLVYEAAYEKQVEVGVIIEDSVPDAIVCDDTRIRQIILNLCSNAVKFTDDGFVLVRMFATHPRGSSKFDVPSVMLHVDVVDTGIGISTTTQSRLFQRFQQADASYNRRFGGTGLGLAISLQLATLMGAELSCTSALGEGSTFHFNGEFPVAERVEEFSVSSTMNTIQVVVWVDHLLVVIVPSETLRDVVANYATQVYINVRVRVVPFEAFRAKDLVEWAVDVIGDWRHDHVVFMLDDIYFTVTKPGAHWMSEMQARVGVPKCVVLQSPISNGGLPKALTALEKPVRKLQFERALRRAISADMHQHRNKNEFTVALIPKNVMCVDDQEANIMLMKGILSALGHRPHAFTTSEAALLFVMEQHHNLDIALIDCHLPRMDGWALCREIREFERKTNAPPLPLVACTADIMDDCKAKCMKAGMDSILLKPFKVEDLEDMLDRLGGCRPSPRILPKAAAELLPDPMTGSGSRRSHGSRPYDYEGEYLDYSTSFDPQTSEEYASLEKSEKEAELEKSEKSLYEAEEILTSSSVDIHIVLG